MRRLTPKRIVLFMFDRNPRVCRSRVDFLRRLNPDAPIHGLFGGEYGYKRTAHRLAGKSFLQLDSLYLSPRSGRSNWNQSDLLLAHWYRKVGCRLDFDTAYLVEWDILFVASLAQIYAHVPDDAVALTAFTPISAIEKDWVWVQRPADRREWQELLAYARSTWGYDGEPHASWGGGPVFPRRFLEKIAAIEIPHLSTQEIRIPVFAQIFGFRIVDTGLRRGWDDPVEDRYFNLNSREIDRATIMAELAKPDGRRAFHPVRTVVRNLEEFA
jgi:hypothetical protein